MGRGVDAPRICGPSSCPAPFKRAAEMVQWIADCNHHPSGVCEYTVELIQGTGKKSQLRSPPAVENAVDTARADILAQHGVAAKNPDLCMFLELGIQLLERDDIHRALLARHEYRAIADLAHFEADEIGDRIVFGGAVPGFLHAAVMGLRIRKTLKLVEIEIA